MRFSFRRNFQKLLLVMVYTVFGHSPAQAALAATDVPTKQLSLEDYLARVLESHQGIKAAQLKATGLAKEAREASLITGFNLYGKAQWQIDEKQMTNPTFQGTKTSASVYSLGITEASPIGLQGKLAYDLNYISIEGANSTFVPQPNYYEGRPSLELKQSLWRNFFGSETRALKELTEAKALSSSFGEGFKLKQLLAAAEIAYWRLLLSQQTWQVRKTTFDRSSELRNWANQRTRLELADRSDFLQAEAAFKLRKLELQRAEDDQREAASSFNAFLGIDSEKVDDPLMPPSVETLSALSVPERMQRREDTLAAEQFKRLTAANAQLTRERARPVFEVSGSLALNGRNVESGQVIGDSFGSDHPTYALGISVSTPLHFGAMHSISDGAQKEKYGAELEFQRKVFEEEQEWKNLAAKFNESKNRLLLAHSLENTQNEKLLYERRRLQRGRTTTFQVLNFEQDHLFAQLNRLLAETELLNIYAQLKTFRAVEKGSDARR